MGAERLCCFIISLLPPGPGPGHVRGGFTLVACTIGASLGLGDFRFFVSLEMQTTVHAALHQQGHWHISVEWAQEWRAYPGQIGSQVRVSLVP